MGAENAIGAVVDIARRIGRRIRRIETARAGRLGELVKVVENIGVDTIHIDFQLVSRTQIGTIHPQVLGDVFSICEAVIKCITVLCELGAVDIQDELVVVLYPWRVLIIGLGGDLIVSERAGLIEGDGVERDG